MISSTMNNKVVIITGGSSGIGRALAFEFGNHGARIVITGRRKEALDQTGEDLKAAGIECLFIQSDVTIEDDCKRMADQTIQQFGRIDILINNAGVSMRASFEEVEIDVIRKVMDINFYGAVNATKYCLPHIIQTKGSVIGISSIAGFRGLPGRVGYTASKFALNGFLEVIRTEMLYKGVHVLIVCPWFTTSNIRKTALSADGHVQGESPREESKMMSAGEVAKHIYKATKRRRKVLKLTVQGKLLIFLTRLFPGIMDRVVYKQMSKEPNSPFKLPGS